jgi:hypothetical protein
VEISDAPETWWGQRFSVVRKKRSSIAYPRDQDVIVWAVLYLVKPRRMYHPPGRIGDAPLLPISKRDQS